MATKPQLHIAMFPWLALGHMLPFLELSKFLVLKGHKVSFISTPRNIRRLPKSPTRDRISFVEIPLPNVGPSLPQGAEATTDITTGEEMSLLKKAADALEPEVRSFLESSKPDWIICDFFPHWLPDIAKRLEIIKCAYFSVFNTKLLAFVGPPDVLMSGADYRKTIEEYTVMPKWVEIETGVAFRKFEAEKLYLASNEMNVSGVSDKYRTGKLIHGCDVILVRQCREFEPEWLTVAEEIFRKPMIPIGLLPPQLHVDDNDSNEWFNIKNWLDGYDKETVVYVALGSEITLTQDQLTELALGLELSNVPFFWVQRNISVSGPIQLPDGFEERVSGRGIVWKSWAPQNKVLNHGSVGAYLTHCGWSSVIEALTFGRALICLPFVADNGLNSRAITEKQMGVEVPRNEEDGSYARNDVAEAVKLAILDIENGMKIRAEAKRASLVFGDAELHQGYLNNLVHFLETFSKC